MYAGFSFVVGRTNAATLHPDNGLISQRFSGNSEEGLTVSVLQSHNEKKSER